MQAGYTARADTQRAVADYIAGMTDRFALREHERLTGRRLLTGRGMRRPEPAVIVVLAGISAALHIGKLPPALPVLRDALRVGLVQAGFLLSLVQVAGMTLGLAMGAAADSLGPRRTMVLGLVILSLASAAGGHGATAEALLALRALEGVGFLLASLPAPGLIRRLVEPDRLNAMLGTVGRVHALRNRRGTAARPRLHCPQRLAGMVVAARGPLAGHGVAAVGRRA